MAASASGTYSWTGVKVTSSGTKTEGVRQHLSAAQVAELAELFEDAPRRVGIVDKVLQAAAEGRGMTLVLDDRLTGRRSQNGHNASRGAARSGAHADAEPDHER
jgi:hypothetical protein